MLKVEQPETNHNKLEETWNKRNKKSLLLCGWPSTLIDSQWFWIALIFISNKALVGREMEKIKKVVLHDNWYCREKSMLKWLHNGCLEFSEQLDIIDCIGKYFLIEKFTFLTIQTFAFMMHKFALSVPWEFFWL